MIIDVKKTTMRLVIPDGYEQLKAKNPLKAMQNYKEGYDVYQKVTANANCIVIINKTSAEAAMNFEDLQGLIEGIHSALGENQGLIEANSGLTERGYRYIYSIVRSVIEQDFPLATYFLRMNLEHEGNIVELRADFTEYGSSGQRDSTGACFAHMAGLVDMSQDDFESGWREDPYDPLFKRGLPMNLSEREGLDGLFPDHPLSQAREFIHAVLKDELMLPSDEQTGACKEGTDNTKTDQDSGETTGTIENTFREMSQEELYRFVLSKDATRRFIPQKVFVEIPEKKQKKPIDINIKAVIKNGTEKSKEGLEQIKENAIHAEENVVKAASIIREKSKDAQMSMLEYVDKQKNARFLKAKLSAFEDGLKEGKIQAVDYIKKYANFCMASTAISYYFARCDGSISVEEMLEIEHDLDSIIKNKDLPAALKKKLLEISENKDLAFDEVCQYLDGVGIETLKEFSRDIDEIILADDKITQNEEKARADFDTYLKKRMEMEVL